MKQTVIACFSCMLVVAGSFALRAAESSDTSEGWVSIHPREFTGAINNPLKGFRAYKGNGYGLLQRVYMPWNRLELAENDAVGRILDYTNKETSSGGETIEEQNVKIVPRVYLDWKDATGGNGEPQQYWPADMHRFDYDSPEFQVRLKRMIGKLGEAWDDDPRIFVIQMGMIGQFGEHHDPAPTLAQRRLLADAFRKAFKNKPVLVRHTDPEFMDAGFGIYYDTFGYIAREPPDGDRRQPPWHLTTGYSDLWKRAPIEGEVEYNWQNVLADAKPDATFGRTPDETLTVPRYRRYMIDKIRKYHVSYLGWISSYTCSNPDVLAGAAEIQKAFGYRFVLESFRYPSHVNAGGHLHVELGVRNTGSAPFYLAWPVAVGFLDSETRQPVWSAPLSNVDVRRWMPGERWNSEAFAYEVPAKLWTANDHVALPDDLTSGEYILALAILDRQGGMVPSARFAIENYLSGGWHPLGRIGVGRAIHGAARTGIEFDSPAFDPGLSYRIPPGKRSLQPPPPVRGKVVKPWKPDPKVELIDPWRPWYLERRSETLEKRIRFDGPVEGPAGRKVITVFGDYGPGSNLSHTFYNHGKLQPGTYRFTVRLTGTPGRTVTFDVADQWSPVVDGTTIKLTGEWKTHRLEFHIRNPFAARTRLRIGLPDNAKGQCSITDYHLTAIGDDD